MRHFHIETVMVVLFISGGQSISLTQNVLGSRYNLLTAIDPTQTFDVYVRGLNEGTPACQLRGKVDVRVGSKPLVLLCWLVLVVSVRFFVRCSNLTSRH